MIHKGTELTKAARERAWKASIAAAKARKEADHSVDWDAVIKRFKADMAIRYAEEGK